MKNVFVVIGSMLFAACAPKFPALTPAQVIRAAGIIRPKVLFPYHYSETDLSSIPAQLSGEGIDVRIRHYE